MSYFCSFVAVVVVKNPPPVNFDQSSYNAAQAYDLSQPQTAYITAAWDRKAIENKEVPGSINVGDQMVTVANNVQYPNAMLDSNTNYAVFVRFHIDADDMDQPFYVYSATVMTRTGQFEYNVLSYHTYFFCLQLFHSVCQAF